MEACTEIRDEVAELCARFPGPYRRTPNREMAYPTGFVNALAESGSLSVMLAADPSLEAAGSCIQTRGGLGFAEAYDVVRKVRQTRLHQVAPVSTKPIPCYLSEHVPGMKRSR